MARRPDEIIAEMMALQSGGQSQGGIPTSARVTLNPTSTEATARGSHNEIVNVADYEAKKGIDAKAAADEAYLKKASERALARKDFNQLLDVFLTVDERLPRGQGSTVGIPNRLIEGAKSQFEGTMNQDSERGAAYAAHDAAAKNLRTVIARLRDVGNLNENEQRAAEAVIPNAYDSEKVRRVKTAYMRMLVPAIDSGNTNLVDMVFKQIKADSQINEDNQRKQKSDLDGGQLSSLGLDPNKFEIVGEE